MQLYAKKLNPTSKKAVAIIDAYRRSNCYDVRDAYCNPSCYKVASFYRIFDEMIANKGEELKVTGFNSSFYSCAYRIPSENCIVYHTHRNRFVIHLG